MDLPSVLEKSTSIGLSIGAVLPLIAAVILRPHWSSDVKHGIVGALAAVSGLGTVAATGSLTSSTLLNVSTITAVYAASQLAYTALWHKYGIAQTIETKTSPLNCPDNALCNVVHGICEKCEKWLGLTVDPAQPADTGGADAAPAEGSTSTASTSTDPSAP
jgi:hypothetical protein